MWTTFLLTRGVHGLADRRHPEHAPGRSCAPEINLCANTDLVPSSLVFAKCESSARLSKAKSCLDHALPEMI
jgi:hypothetical protein